MTAIFEVLRVVVLKVKSSVSLAGAAVNGYRRSACIFRIKEPKKNMAYLPSK